MRKVFGEFAFVEEKEEVEKEEYTVVGEETAMCICPECLEEFDAKKNIVEEEKSNKIQHIKKELLR